jgi:hypothetical protein
MRRLYKMDNVFMGFTRIGHVLSPWGGILDESLCTP